MGSKSKSPDDYGLIELAEMYCPNKTDLAENRKYAQNYAEWAFECGLTEYQARHSNG